MSRIGKKPIIKPAGVEVKIDGKNVSVKGPKGELSYDFCPEIVITLEEGKIFTNCKKEEGKISARRKKAIAALWGTTRALIFNMIEGVSNGFEKKLEIQGIGYKAVLEGEDLVLNLGFSHPVKMQIPKELNVSVDKNVIVISGISKEKVGQFAAVVRKIRPPEPYKGKGIRYMGEVVRRKLGKKAATASS